MEYNWKEQRRSSNEPYLVIPCVFSPTQCQQILTKLPQLQSQLSSVGNGKLFSVVDKDRSSTQYKLPISLENQWIYERLHKVFIAASALWGLDVREIIEPAVILKYEIGDHFSQWHVDAGTGSTCLRKISMSIELTDPREYEGGSLEVFPLAKIKSTDCDIKVGQSTCFPSHRYHRVSHVSKGTRYALVCWISGPPLT